MKLKPNEIKKELSKEEIEYIKLQKKKVKDKIIKK